VTLALPRRRVYSYRAVRGVLLSALMILGCRGPRAAPDAPPQVFVEAPDAPATIEEEAPAVAPAMTPASETSMRDFSQGLERFGWSLFRRVAARPGNRVYSPAAAAVSLSMAASLDRGPAADEARRVLSDTLDADALHRAAGSVLRRWQTELGEGSGLLAVQRVFIDRAVRLDDAVTDRLRAIYGAPVGVVDTGGPEGARRRIDGFLHARTHGAVPEAVPEHAVVADAPAIVASSALARFVCEGEVTSLRFRVGAVEPADTRAIRCGGAVTRARGEGFTLWRIASRDGAQTLDVVLPDEAVRVRELEARLDATVMHAATEALRPADVTVTIPTVRVTNESPEGLRNALFSMGCGGLFDPERSTLARVGPGGRWVSELFHRARFELDGADATRALTAPAERIDRPFLFVLRDARLGVALAMGHVVDPGQ
jgi:serpin B